MVGRKLKDALTGRATPMSVASRAQARLTIAREVKAAIKRPLGLNLSTAISLFLVNGVFDSDMMSIMMCSTPRRSAEQKIYRRRRRKSKYHDMGKGVIYFCGVSRISFPVFSKKG